jgi:hypothetical protein
MIDNVARLGLTITSLVKIERGKDTSHQFFNGLRTIYAHINVPLHRNVKIMIQFLNFWLLFTIKFVMTLRLAIRYIRHLQMMLDGQEAAPPRHVTCWDHDNCLYLTPVPAAPTAWDTAPNHAELFTWSEKHFCLFQTSAWKTKFCLNKLMCLHYTLTYMYCIKLAIMQDIYLFES